MGLFDIFSNKDAENAANARNAGLQQGYDALSTNYGQGRGAITSNYGAALPGFQSLATLGKPGADAYADASGANGADGYARARTNFQTNPGYQFQFDQGLQAIDRGAASRGMVTSGNTLNAEQAYGTGLADQSYKGYLAGLQPYLGQQQAGQVTSATGQAGVLTGQGNALNANYTGLGTAANANYTGQGNATAAADLNNYNVSNNMWGALMQGGKLAAGAFGGGAFPGLGDSSGNPGSLAFGSNPFTPSGGRNSAYG